MRALLLHELPRVVTRVVARACLVIRAGLGVALVAFGSAAPLLAADPPQAAGDAREAAPPSGAYGFSLANLRVDRALLVEGGPGRDGIKPVDEPRFAPLTDATWVAADTPVLGVAVGDVARAYPIHLLEWHQIVNDAFDGAPVLVSFDPIAGAPRAFRRVVDGRTLRFGVSGLLYNSSFVMYDRETESLWSQFDGRAIAGPLAGRTLEALPVRQEPMALWLARQPETLVLERPLLRQIDYRHSPFKGYWVADRIPYPVQAQDTRYHAKEIVTGVVADGKSRAYLGSRMTARGGGVEDEFAGRKIQVAYDSSTATFAWEVPDGVEVAEAYWFAWKAWHPETEIWGEAKPGQQ